MYIPIKVDYGVRALVDLAQHAADRPVRASEIARRAAIPQQYLAQVLHTLHKNGFTGSQRGPQGGHFLVMEPAEIRLSSVMLSLGGGDTLVPCLTDNSTCIHSPCCAQREVWRTVANAVHSILDSTTIADLVSDTPMPASMGGDAMGDGAMGGNMDDMNMGGVGEPETGESGALPIRLETAV